MEASNLFKPLKIGDIEVQNRIVLAPLTRLRMNESHIPLPIVTEYYSQRASSPGTLLISEATFISPEAGIMENAPGIWNNEQIVAWRKVTDAVHEKKSFIFMQLWALGRVATLSCLKKEVGEDAKVVGPSNIPIPQTAEVGYSERRTPTPLTENEIHKYINLYAQAAKNAITAGFDGVEIHGANGYLVDQFIQDVSNDRNDAWGGSVENRARFAIEVTKAVAETIGARKTALRVSPFTTYQGMGMKDYKPQFTYLAQELSKLGIAYLHAVSSRVDGITDVDVNQSLDFLMDAWGNENPFLIAGGFTPASAKKMVDEDEPHRNIAVVFGRLFIANPDLVFRIKNGIELNPYDRSTFYIPETERGYTTYTFSEEYLKQTRGIAVSSIIKT